MNNSLLVPDLCRVKTERNCKRIEWTGKNTPLEK